ncbi:MAG: aminotransferase class V-fold PLP-dependent enzyme, partial [Bacteroidetes bacterium]
AYLSPLPQRVEAAGHRGLERKRRPWEITPRDFFQPLETVRTRFAHLLDSSEPERVALLPSVSYGMAVVARNTPLAPGQEILLLEEQFPSNFYVWKKLADLENARLRVISPPEEGPARGRRWNERILESIGPKTALVTLPHIHWADGTRFDLEAIRERSREVGALLVIDGSQSIGAMPFSVRQIQPDAVICVAYKWLLGPYSSALGWFGPAFDEGQPIEESWMNRLGSEDFQRLVHYQERYRPQAWRYNVGEASNFIAIPMIAEALAMILEWSVPAIADYCRRLTQPAAEWLAQRGCRVEEPSARAPHLFGVRFPEHFDSAAARAALQAAGIFVSWRGRALRISPYLYNRSEDLEKLLDVLESSLKPRPAQP